MHGCCRFQDLVEIVSRPWQVEMMHGGQSSIEVVVDSKLVVVGEDGHVAQLRNRQLY